MVSIEQDIFNLLADRAYYYAASNLIVDNNINSYDNIFIKLNSLNLNLNDIIKPSYYRTQRILVNELRNISLCKNKINCEALISEINIFVEETSNYWNFLKKHKILHNSITHYEELIKIRDICMILFDKP